ncbi:MAG: LacI family transcriptional regulator [Christensenellaceae bacterium]|nr:LacI family transcriptional regulator [Christensenellaceae bacterium]
MTIREIARLAGVSPSAVSIAINNGKGISDETRRHILQVVKENNYKVPKTRKSSKRHRFVLVKYLDHGLGVEENQGFITSIVDQIEAECRRYSYDLQMINCNGETAKNTLENIMQNPPEGVILIATEMLEISYKMLDLITVPIVILDNGIKYKNIDTVVMANEHIGYNATDYLYNLGHRDISYFKTSRQMHNCDERYEGYLKRMRELNLPIKPPVLLTASLKGAYHDMKKQLSNGSFKPKGAAVADNDTIAIGAIKAMQEAGYKVPEDVSVIGVDDIPFGAVTMPALTTMRINREALGTLTVEIIRKRIQNPTWPGMHIEVVGELIERGSTRQA